jgi:hypothetical protein
VTSQPPVVGYIAKKPEYSTAASGQSEEVEVFEEDSAKTKLPREFPSDTIGSALKRCRETFHHLCNTRE